MAFVNRQTWRCKFIDIDESFRIRTQDEQLIGWMALLVMREPSMPLWV